jgi:alpha-methylacyl-CoA racemase
VGALEPRFFAVLKDALHIQKAQNEPALRDELAAIFATQPRDHWCGLLEGSDACFAPVLDMADAPGHPHNRARGTFTEPGGLTQPAPAPRFKDPSC